MDSSTPRARFFALDAARGFAVVAMVIAHTAPFINRTAPGAVTYLEGILNDLAAPLFALVIGATMALTTRSPLDNPAERGRYRLETVIKAVALIVLGLALEVTYSGVDIVLDYLGFALLVSVPFLFLSNRVLLVLAAAVTAVGPIVVGLITTASTTQPALVGLPRPGMMLLDWIALGSHYRLMGLLPLILAGLALGRVLVNGGKLPVRWIIAVCVVVFVVAQGWRLADLPGSEIRGGFFEVIRDTAMAVGAFTAIALLTDLATEPVRRQSRRFLAPFAVQGTMALSIYVLHVLILMLIYGPLHGRQLIAAGSAVGWAIQVGLLVVCWAFAAAWWRWLGTGPIERIMGILDLRHPLSSLWTTRFADNTLPESAPARRAA